MSSSLSDGRSTVVHEESADRGRLDDVLQQAAAADPGSLPLLEFTLDALYEVGRQHGMLTFAAYRALGGLEGAIARRADDVVDALPPAIQEALPPVLRALTTVRPGDEKVTARPALLTEVAGTPARLALVDALIAARLLVSDEDAGGHVFVRVAHEALLSRWPHASDIVNANRNFLETRARLTADAHRWHSDNRNQDLLLPSGKRLAEGEELLLSRREEVDDQVIEYIEASSRAQQEREEKDRRAERTLIEAAEAAKRERLEREAERRSHAAAAASRLARRTRYAATVAIVLALMASAGAFIGFTGQQEAMRQAALATSAKKEAVETRDQALRNQSLSLSLLSEQTAASGNTEAAILLALEALPAGTAALKRPYLPEAEAALHKALLGHRQTRIFSQGAGLAHAAFNRSGDRIVGSSYDNTARIWDVQTGAEIAILKGHQAPLERAEFSPDGSRIITAARDGTARIWNAATGEQLFVLQPLGDLPTATFSPDGKQVLIAGEDRSVSVDPSLWDVQTGRKVLAVESSSSSLGSFSPDGKSFAIAQGVGRTVFVWDAENGKLKRKLRVNTSPYSVAFSPDGSRILISSWGSNSSLWDIAKGTQIAALAGHKSDTQLQGVTFDHGGRRIATVSLDGTARIWDGTFGTLLKALGEESSGIKRSQFTVDERDQEMNSVFSQDDRLLATASVDGRIRIWDVERGSLLATIIGHSGLIEHLEFRPGDNAVLLSASHDGTARLWDIDGVLTTSLAHDYRPIFALFSPDNAQLLTGGGDSFAHLWDVESGREIAKLDTHEIIQIAAFSPDGSQIATATVGGRIVVWDVRGRREVGQIKSRDGLVQVQFSPKGDLLVSASMHGTAQLWDAATSAELAEINTTENLPRAIFSPDGKLVLAATNDNVARLFETDGTEFERLVGHQDRITAAAFSPDGELAVTGSLDHTARIWSIRNGSIVATLKGHSDALTVVAFSPNGQSVLTAARDGAVRIWSVPTGAEKVVLWGHGGAIDSAQFSRNGSYILTVSSQDRTVRLWAAQSGREIAVIASREDQTNRPALIRAAFNSDGTRIAVVSGEERVRVIRVFQSPQDLIDYAKHAVPRELTACERRRFFLPVEGEVGDCPS